MLLSNNSIGFNANGDRSRIAEIPVLAVQTDPISPIYTATLCPINLLSTSHRLAESYKTSRISEAAVMER